ncbi:uncharacterized protein B0I36DRAFT_329723 [Microdochium trichocladiopsis]|uniref:CCHC-type domain-containing protein n=1 Tax=Microdochium trichocladiopsis TaxID=1682393 RepID=A0A9P8XZL8_9PEZI|nr:uncharacterized protein B0I36DRAFT_329723 [Microdochium trichocladiopsis]KAH7026028.1 hypothetical protein B0I36DRAFT_329723 [Microdochium trichocladiopsis]
MARECPQGGDTRDCRKCGEVGHISRDCPQGGGGGGSRECFKCGQAGHIARECPSAQETGDSQAGHGSFAHAAGSAQTAALFDNKGEGPTGQEDGQWNSAASGANEDAWTKAPSSAVDDW